MVGRSRSQKLFAYFNIAVALWGLGNFFAGIAPSPETAITAWRAAYLGGLFISTFFYHLVQSFFGVQRKKLLFLAYLHSFFFAGLMILHPASLVSATRPVFGIHYNVTTPAMSAAILAFLVIVGVSYKELLSLIFHSQSPQKMQAKYFIFGFAFGFFGGATTLLPPFGVDVIYPIGNLGVAIYAMILTYAIFRYKLLDIQIVIKRTALYSCFIFILSLLYISAIFGLNKILENSFSNPFGSVEFGKFINAFALSGLLIGLASTSMAVWVYVNGRNSTVNRLWSIFCLAVSFWGFGGFAIGLSRNSASALISWRVAYIGVTFIPALFYHFVIVFLGLRRRIRLIGVYLASSIFLVADATPLLIPQTTWMFNELYFLFPPGNIYPYFVAYFFLMIFVSHFELWRFMRMTKDELRRSQIKWFLMATVIGFSGGATCFLPSFDIRIYPYGNFLVPLYPLIMSYAILKHQLLDIQVVIRKTLYYSFLTVGISLIYLLIVFLFYSVFLTRNGTPSVLMSFVGILFIAMTFKPLEIWLHRTLERKFFKGTIGEISEQNERLETELERRERLRSVGILAAGMAHEIKNPLTVINTFADYLPTKYNDPEFREKFSRIVKQEVARVKEIVSDLLAFSKPADPNPKQTDIRKIITDVLELLSSTMLKNGIKAQVLLDGATAFVDPDQIKQALLNIIMNALDAMQERGGELTVRAITEANALKIAIQDTGCGIPADKIGSIFDPFYTDKEQGTGLGLAVTHSIIEKNRGKISVQSKVGEGTIFTIELPSR